MGADDTIATGAIAYLAVAVSGIDCSRPNAVTEPPIKLSPRVDPKLHHVLDEEVPRAGRLENIDAAPGDAYELFRSYLDAHRSEIDVVDLDLAAFILVTTVEALTHSAVLHQPQVLVDEKVGEFVDEVTQLLLRYLGTRSPLGQATRATL